MDEGQEKEWKGGREVGGGGKVEGREGGGGGGGGGGEKVEREGEGRGRGRGREYTVTLFTPGK